MNRDDGDDEVLPPHRWAGAPRPSEPTRVGLGPHIGDTPVTPISLTDYTRDVGTGPPTPRVAEADQLFASVDATTIMSQLSVAIAERKDETAALRIDMYGKIDTCIDEVRAVAKAQREQAASQAKRDEAQAKRDEALFALLPIPARIATVEALAKDLDERVGQAPNKLTERASLTRELTATEYVELERGTGLAGVTGRLVAADRRLAARIGLVAVVASTVPQVALVLLAEGHVAWILYAVAALVLAAVSVFAFRRVRRAWRTRQ